jgi:hypothetical protein
MHERHHWSRGDSVRLPGVFAEDTAGAIRARPSPDTVTDAKSAAVGVRPFSTRESSLSNFDSSSGGCCDSRYHPGQGIGRGLLYGQKQSHHFVAKLLVGHPRTALFIYSCSRFGFLTSALPGVNGLWSVESLTVTAWVLPVGARAVTVRWRSSRRWATSERQWPRWPSTSSRQSGVAWMHDRRRLSAPDLRAQTTGMFKEDRSAAP